MKAKFKANNKAVSLMWFLVYLLLTLNITISFSSVVSKQALCRLRIGYNCGFSKNYFYKSNNDYDYVYGYVYDYDYDML